MASSALEEKINKIRLQNEEIRRRYKEVEADKKNAAKLNALVQLVPSDDWPERKEPPEFSAPPKTVQKQKSVTKDRENERPSQHYAGIQERLAKKEHKFAEGDGPPPDPKYNFLADSEREMRTAGNSKSEEDKNKTRNRTPRGGAGPKRRGCNNAGGGGSRDAFFKDNRGPQAFHGREEFLPEYEAWRAERNRIDEARINRQKTAEGNWRREWDCNKVSLEKDQPRRDFNRKDSNSYDRKNNYYDNDYSSRGHGGSRTYHQSQRNYSQDYRHPHHEQPHEFKRQQSDCKTPLSPVDNRTVAAFDQSIKVTVNHGNQANKATVMSVKVNSPSIAGTGRVGPRQKSRITYSSQSDSSPMAPESNSLMRQKSFDEKTAAASFNNGLKLAPKSPFSQRKKEGNSKSPYFSKKEFKSDESARPKSQPKASNSQRNESRDQRQSNTFVPKPQRIQKRKLESNKTGNVSVAEDSVPVENDINKPIDESKDSIGCEINKIGKEFSDLSNVSAHVAADNSGVTGDIEENVSFDNEKNVFYDSNIVNEKTIAYENAAAVIDEQFEDHAEENRKNIKIDNSDENRNPIQNNCSFDVYSCLVGDSTEGKTDNDSADSNKAAIADDEKIIETCRDITLTASSDLAIAEASVHTQPLETEEFSQTLNDCKDEKTDLDLKVEQKESAMKEPHGEEITDKQGAKDGVINEEFQQLNAVEDSKVEDNSANDLVESEENIQIADESLHKVDNDSGFLDNAESELLNKTSTTGTNDSAIQCDSHIIEDLDDSLDNSGAEDKNDEISPEPAECDFVDITKDDSRKAVEICDNASAASSKTQMSEDKEKTDEILKNSIENENQCSETSKVIRSQEENMNTLDKKVEQISEDFVQIISEESKE